MDALVPHLDGSLAESDEVGSNTDGTTGDVGQRESLVVRPRGLARDHARSAKVLHPDAVHLNVSPTMGGGQRRRRRRGGAQNGNSSILSTREITQYDTPRLTHFFCPVTFRRSLVLPREPNHRPTGNQQPINHHLGIISVRSLE